MSSSSQPRRRQDSYQLYEGIEVAAVRPKPNPVLPLLQQNSPPPHVHDERKTIPICCKRLQCLQSCSRAHIPSINQCRVFSLVISYASLLPTTMSLNTAKCMEQKAQRSQSVHLASQQFSQCHWLQSHKTNPANHNLGKWMSAGWYISRQKKKACPAQLSTETTPEDSLPIHFETSKCPQHTKIFWAAALYKHPNHDEKNKQNMLSPVYCRWVFSSFVYLLGDKVVC